MTDDDTITVQTPACAWCQKTEYVTVPRKAFNAWRHGTFIQDAFPWMSNGQREQLKTGIHPGCWEAMMFDEEDMDEGWGAA